MCERPSKNLVLDVVLSTPLQLPIVHCVICNSDLFLTSQTAAPKGRRYSFVTLTRPSTANSLIHVQKPIHPRQAAPCVYRDPVSHTTRERNQSSASIPEYVNEHNAVLVSAVFCNRVLLSRDGEGSSLLANRRATRTDT